MQQITSHTTNSSSTLALLRSHLPYSLPLLRRLQFMNLPGGSTPTSHILTTFSGDVPRQDEPFTIAYLDLSRGPETEMWIYSSFEHPDHSSASPTAKCQQQILSMMRHIGHVVKEWEAQLESRQEKRGTPKGVALCGTMHGKVLDFLDDDAVHGRENQLIHAASGGHLKFIFETGKMPEEKDLSGEYEWGVVREEDLELVLERTEIPRKVRTMKLLPSAVVRVVGTGELVAWGFLGPDGSLTSLHVEAEYRGKGLAKAVASKLFRERTHMFGLEELGHADVVMTNKASCGVCTSLGGKMMWSDYWVWVDLVALEEVYINKS